MVALTFGLLAACKNEDKKADDPGEPTSTVQDDDTADAEDGADANSVDTDTQLLGSSLVSSSAGALGLASITPGDLGTEDVGGNVGAVFFPRACVKTAAKGSAANEEVYTFTNCLGPNGLLGVSGTVDVVYTVSANSLHLDITLSGLTDSSLMKINGAELDGHATADITAASETKRTMTWAGQLSGTTVNGKKFSHQSNHTVTWSVGDKCFSLEGVSDGQIRAREIKTEIKNFQRCGRGCPEAGGEIVVTNVAKQKSITVDFDGTATADFTGPGGKTTPIPLICKP